MPTPTQQIPVLRDAAGQRCDGQPLALPVGGVELRLDVGADQELDPGTAVRMKPVAGQLVDLAPSTSCDTGDFSSGKKVKWLLADWGAEQPLSFINVQTANQGKARAKVFSNGAWVPLIPVDIIDTGSEQSISPTVCGKIMIELVQAHTDYPGLWESAPAEVTGLSLRAATAPGDLELRVAGRAFGFRVAGLLPEPGMPVTGFAEAVNAYLSDPKAVRPVPLHLAAGLAGVVQVEFNPVPVTVVRQLEANAGGVVPLLWKEAGKTPRAEGTGRIVIGQQAQLLELGMQAEAQLTAEALPFAAVAEETRFAQLAGASTLVSQLIGSAAQQPVLSGVDLRLRARGQGFRGTLALHQDQHGFPGPTPYGGATLPVAWPAGADPRGPDGWLSLNFERPLRLPDAQWWAVLTVQEGEALWDLGEQPPQEVGSCLYRRGDGAWLKRGDRKWAQTRLRLATPEKPKAPPEIRVQRGAVAVSLGIADGMARADAAALKALNGDPSGTLEIIVVAAGAGSFRVRDLRAVFR